MLKCRDVVDKADALVDGSPLTRRERFALRPCFINPRQGLDEAERLVADVLEIGRELAAGS